jgi:methylenetetrahydrofolate reductase (NADPH)
MARIADAGLLERVFVLVSVYVTGSTLALRSLRDVVPGVDVPDAVMARLERAPSDRQAEEGFPSPSRPSPHCGRSGASRISI